MKNTKDFRIVLLLFENIALKKADDRLKKTSKSN